MPKVRFPTKADCPHVDKHPVWVGHTDGEHIALCQMADSHLYNTARLLKRTRNKVSGDDANLVDFWINAIDIECARRFKNNLMRAMRKTT